MQKVFITKTTSYNIKHYSSEMFCQKLFKQHLVIVLLLATISKGAAHSSPNKYDDVDDDGRIVGGVETSITYFPYQASLQLEGEHTCGASILNQRYLITAAHCVTEYNRPEIYTIRIGSTEHARGGVLHHVRRIKQHAHFNEPTSLNNDIALLELEKRLSYARNVQPITLVTTKDNVAADARLYVSGWGFISSEAAHVAKRLRYTNVSLQDHHNCTLAYQGAGMVTQTMLCAGSGQGGRDSCQGDSGGPLVTTVDGVLKLYGLVSWGIGCAHPDYPGVYTKVAAFEEWVRQNMAKM